MSGYTKTYALATRTEADCELGTGQAPIGAIQTGDIVIFGNGTLELHYAEVVEIEDVYNEYGCYTVVTCADGRSFSDTANGFWRTVIKRNRAATEAAVAASAAYARAWDRKR